MVAPPAAELAPPAGICGPLLLPLPLPLVQTLLRVRPRLGLPARLLLVMDQVRTEGGRCCWWSMSLLFLTQCRETK